MREIKDALRLITLGTYVIGTKYGDRENLMTAAWLTQVSSNPASLAIAIGKTHYTAELIDCAGCFSVSILTEIQHDIAIRCGFTSGRNTNKMMNEITNYSKNSMPVIQDAAAYLDCQVVNKIDANDHVLYIAKVIDAELKSRNTLTYNFDIFFK